ncbi:MAG TPA: HAD hydrolase family protein [Elusimicrobiales bacterium]|nr:HAD hydrolase family protein [Elusimicrobiales bacterium]
MKKPDLLKRAKKIKMVLMDVDGVLTDGQMFHVPGPDGRMVEFKGFHALDGIGLRLLRGFGIKTGVITGRRSPATEDRARSLCMSYIFMGFLAKTAPFERVLSETGIRAEEVAYIGDDWTDIPVMKRCGLACAPANAVEEGKKYAHYVARKSGGSGAVREICDFILKSQGRWPAIMEMVESGKWDSLPPENPVVVNAHQPV